jgi:hypothetical protein
MSENLFDTLILWSCYIRSGCQTFPSTLFTVQAVVPGRLSLNISVPTRCRHGERVLPLHPPHPRLARALHCQERARVSPLPPALRQVLQHITPLRGQTRAGDSGMWDTVFSVITGRIFLTLFYTSD